MASSSGSEEAMYPILFMPKRCTSLETNCGVNDNVFIEMTITSPDTEGNNMCIYTGYCNIKLIDSYDVSILNVDDTRADSEETLSEETLSRQSFSDETLSRQTFSDETLLGENFCEIEIEDMPLIVADQQMPAYTQSQVWIDPTRSPHVYNSCDVTRSRELYQSHTSITYDEHKTMITKNVYKEAIHYSARKDSQKAGGKVRGQAPDYNNYESDEFELGVFLSQLPEEILNEKQNRDREERKYIGLQSENGALKQLMSSDIQSLTRQRKTILFLGPDSQCGHTIQQIGYYDPSVECSSDSTVDSEVTIVDSESPPQKRYQCLKCQQIFDQLGEYRNHVVNHPSSSVKSVKSKTEKKPENVCSICDRKMRNKEKLKAHLLAHEDPDLECDKCRKVFASKVSLRTHQKIHNRKHKCQYCPFKTFDKIESLRNHCCKVHCVHMCDSCDYSTENYKDFVEHKKVHQFPYDSSETELADSLSIFNDVISDDFISDDFITDDFISSDLTDSTLSDWKIDDDFDNIVKVEEIKKADSVIAKVMSNKMFLGDKNSRKHNKCKKICEVCYKSFDRVSDLKRHLIEHVVHSTMKKVRSDPSGSFTITCEICQSAFFSEIDKYKAHLREHAKLTQYKCTFCNKSFSDSSNFSKHKKVHGAPYFQCDLCQRKFQSKKMIIQHMEYHKKNQPKKCNFCDKIFHYPSTLKRHIKTTHTAAKNSRYRCRLCFEYYKSLKDKWDHEWNVHKVRKLIVDCLICNAKFRKYSELKRHCSKEHKVDIPKAQKLLKRKS